MDREWSVFELAQFFSQSALDELVDAMIARGYGGICMPDVKLCWACSDGSYTVAELAARLGVTKQFCAREVAKLRESGFLDVSPSPNDARALAVRLSAKGHKLLNDIAKEKARLENKLAGEIGEERMREFNETLKLLNRN